MPPWNRRELLAGLLVAAVSGCVPARAVRTPAPSAALELQRLSPRTVLIAGAGGNVLATRSTEGLIVIDGGLAEQRTALLAMLEREFPATPIAWLFNTHWHRDQTGLNEWVGQHGGVVCAHENTRLWLATEFYVDWQDRTYEPLPKAALPNRTFYGTREHAQVGDRLVAFGRLPNAHTDGDVFVHLVDEDVLAVGGAVTATGYPLMDYSTGGWLGGVVDASRVLMNQAGAATRVVAGDGAVLGRAALETQLALATTMRERISAQMKLGKSVNDMLAEGLTKDFDARYGDPKFFVRSSYRGLWGHTRELGIV
jgi:glyoxylase-like metal-dependent hydrolase (beta-lactamase superfamily II)